MDNTVKNNASVCAARFRSSRDYAMGSIRIETATNSSPIRPAAAMPATSAKVLQSSKQSPSSNWRCRDASHAMGDYGRFALRPCPRQSLLVRAAERCWERGRVRR